MSDDDSIHLSVNTLNVTLPGFFCQLLSVY